MVEKVDKFGAVYRRDKSSATQTKATFRPAIRDDNKTTETPQKNEGLTSENYSIGQLRYRKNVTSVRFTMCHKELQPITHNSTRI